MRGFRPLSRIAHPALINSYFLGGPSSVKRKKIYFQHFDCFFKFYLNRKV